MSLNMTMLLLGSSIALFLCIAYLEIIGQRRWGVFSALFGGLALAAIVFVPDSVESKGPVDETVAIVLCYLCMLLGMVAEYGYAQAERGHKRLRFEPMTFLMPIFASPIVFIPLLTITTDISFDGAFSKSKLMVYLVAFQNGFFWKGFFEQRRQKALRSLPVQAPLARATSVAHNVRL